MKKDTKIGVVGLGFVGLTLSIASALKGIKVYGLEANEVTKKSIREGKAHFYEPGINNYLENTLNKNFYVVDDFDKKEELDAIIITVGTPLLSDNITPNFEYIKKALGSIGKNVGKNTVIILRSTVAVGTTRQIVMPYLKEILNADDDEFYVGFCPERTIEGRAINELFELPQIISGNNSKALELIEKVFREINPFIVRAQSIEAAELIKLFNNTYRDIQFSIGNYFNEIAQNYDINGISLIELANFGYPRSNIAKPGFVGGPCLSKDAHILTSNLPDNKEKEFILNSRLYNEGLENKVLKWVDNNNLKDAKIAISGIAFKGHPATDDLRGSNQLNIAIKLRELGYKTNLHDYYVATDVMKSYTDNIGSNEIYDAALGSGMLLILNNNSQYSDIDLNKLNEIMVHPKLILDYWGVIENVGESHKELKIATCGNMFISNDKRLS